MNKTMIASRPMTYGTRRLQAGDEFTASRRDARLLAATGRASLAQAGDDPPIAPKEEGQASKLAPEKPDDAKDAPDPEGEDLKALRAEYQEVVGKRPFAGWDGDILREKIAAARG